MLYACYDVTLFQCIWKWWCGWFSTVLP